MLQHQIWSFSLLYFSLFALDLPLSHSLSLFRSSLLVKALPLSLSSGFLSLTDLDLPLSALFSLSLVLSLLWFSLPLSLSVRALALSLSIWSSPKGALYLSGFLPALVISLSLSLS
ncbi:hypothetical protein AMTRI_Chr04g249230 [Amborella trichopoda]